VPNEPSLTQVGVRSGGHEGLVYPEERLRQAWIRLVVSKIMIQVGFWRRVLLAVSGAILPIAHFA
jgi:hypothetical protein